MLLAHVYLTTGDWPNAAKEADDVINSGQFGLVRVENPDDFYKIFAVETSSETSCLYTIQKRPSQVCLHTCTEVATTHTTIVALDIMPGFQT